MTDVPGAGAPPETPARDVSTLVHFGWACAEVRGRHRQILTGRPEAPSDEPKERQEYTLPLNHERSAAELAIQAEGEFAGLATQLGLDFAVARLPHPPSSFTGTVVEQLRVLCKDASTAEGDEARHDALMRSNWPSSVGSAWTDASPMTTSSVPKSWRGNATEMPPRRGSTGDLPPRMLGSSSSTSTPHIRHEGPLHTRQCPSMLAF